jgi:RNA polymerase sigma-70 factor (ECF subfamily)
MMAEEKNTAAHRQLPSEAKLRRYLLGMCGREEAEEIDLAILSEDMQQILEVVEDELIEDYVTGDLDWVERTLFDQLQLRSRSIVEKIEISALLLGREDRMREIRKVEKIHRIRRDDYREMLQDPRFPPRGASEAFGRRAKMPLAGRQEEPKRQTVQWSLRFRTLDHKYLELLKREDISTQEHFATYFGALTQMKLRSTEFPAESIEEIQQETFARFFSALREGKVTQPERLGSFVNSICNNVLMEHHRRASRFLKEPRRRTSEFLSDNLPTAEERKDPPGKVPELVTLAAKKNAKKIDEVLNKLPERDQGLLREIFLEQRDEDGVYREFGVDRNYFRALLRRVRRGLRSLYPKPHS